MRTIFVYVAAALLLGAGKTYAVPIAYALEFNVEYFVCGALCTIDQRVQVGDRYVGAFVVDSSILASDGLNKPGDVSAFSIRMEDAIWSSSSPFPASLFSGFRGPGGLGSTSPGFDVVAGEIANLRGGVYGAGDFPFVDFSVDARVPLPSPGECTGAYCGNSPNSFFTRNPLTGGSGFGGSMLVSRVSEPPTLLLLGLALAGLAFVRRRRPR